MSRINSMVISALEPIAPVGFHDYTGKATTYITFFTYNEKYGIVSDNEEQTSILSVQVDVHSKADKFEQTVRDVKKAMIKIGFVRTSEIELYLKDTKTYRKSIFFRIQLENKEDN